MIILTVIHWSAQKRITSGLNIVLVHINTNITIRIITATIIHITATPLGFSTDIATSGFTTVFTTSAIATITKAVFNTSTYGCRSGL